jgi:hypothetical protein
MSGAKYLTSVQTGTEVFTGTGDHPRLQLSSRYASHSTQMAGMGEVDATQGTGISNARQ